MINELTIKGLKCFDEVEFSFKNLTLLAGKNSLGKSTVIQALLAMIQEGRNPFRGKYIDIRRISELKNKYVGSKEIEITVNHKFVRRMTDDKNEVISEGRLSDEISVRYLSADRIGVRDTYEIALDDPDRIGVRCEYAYQQCMILTNGRIIHWYSIKDPSLPLADRWITGWRGYLAIH